MPRTAAGIRTGPAARLAHLAGQRPEWQSWIQLLKLAWDAAEQDGWAALDHPGLGPDPTESAVPLLHGRTVRVDAERARALLRQLSASAWSNDLSDSSSLESWTPTADDALNLLSAAIAQDSGRMKQLAAEQGLEPETLASLAALAALPVLQSCGRVLLTQLPGYWDKGYCPVCAAWPTLAERRGLDRSRRLRCGRCAADWEVQWLYCIYCGEREHTRLGTLVVSETQERLKVETCATCGGYLKSLATLQSFAPLELLLQDLETVELDLVALERGHSRPGSSPFPLSLRVLGRASR